MSFSSNVDVSICQTRLSYLVKVINSLFSYGLPSSGSKLPVRYAPDTQIPN